MIANLWTDLRMQNASRIQKRLSQSTGVKIFGCIDQERRVGVRFEGHWRPQALPQFQFIALNVSSLSSDTHELEVTLLDGELLALFGLLCDDLISSAESASASINRIVERLIHWKTLLDDPDRGFSKAKMRGLIGELLILLRVADTRGLANSIAAWSGPMATPQDFYFPNFCLEVKTVGPGAKRVQIQTAEQLDPVNDLVLYLCVLMLNDAVTDTPESISVSSLVSTISARLIDDNEAYTAFLGRLQCLGWQATIPANNDAFILSSIRVYKVTESFPRLLISALPRGVSFLRYDVELAAMAQFETVEILKEGSNDDVR
jgi:hypothetical protein